MVFTAGIIVNEILLMVQGIADLNYRVVPFINEMLLAAALILFAGIFIINYGHNVFKYDSTHKPGKNN